MVTKRFLSKYISNAKSIRTNILRNVIAKYSQQNYIYIKKGAHEGKIVDIYCMYLYFLSFYIVNLTSKVSTMLSI